MRRILAGGVGLLAVLVVCSAAHGDSREKQVQTDVRRLLDATYAGKVDVVMALTHPVVIEALGGKVEARKTLGEAMARLAKVQLKIETFEYPEPPAFVEGSGRTYAVIPTRVVVSSGPQKIDSRNFQVGVQDAEAKGWTYVEGPKFEGFRDEHFPDFPADYDYPETSRLD